MLSIEVDVDEINVNTYKEQNQKSLNDNLEENDKDNQKEKILDEPQLSQISQNDENMDDKEFEAEFNGEKEKEKAAVAKRVYVRQFRKGHKEFSKGWDGHSWV